MKKLHFETTINAPAENVWNVMLGEETYSKWTSAFAEGSNFEGSWEKGSKIKFIDPNQNAGMVSQIAENRLHEYISIEHIGIIQNGIEDTESEEAKKWVPAFENYTFVEKDGKTTLSIEQDIEEEYEEMFSKMWPKALEKLKELAEK